MLASLHDLHWAIIGDFNKVTSKEEKSGGNPICQRRVRAIQGYMNVCQMIDLGFSRPKFTWSNKREVGSLIQCRLERYWANLAWKFFFLEANVTHLAKVNSDHWPLLLNINPNRGSASNRAFKFQSIWLSHNDFLAIVKEAWIGKEADLAGAITGFIVKAQRWNKEVLGNVFNRKKQIMAKLMGTQRALANNPNNFLLKLQN